MAGTVGSESRNRKCEGRGVGDGGTFPYLRFSLQPWCRLGIQVYFAKGDVPESANAAALNTVYRVHVTLNFVG